MKMERIKWWSRRRKREEMGMLIFLNEGRITHAILCVILIDDPFVRI